MGSTVDTRSYFPVNGGAFAIAKLLADLKQLSACSIVVGHLRLNHVGYGMIAFTFIMCLDIFIFGCAMRTELDASDRRWSRWEGVLKALQLVGAGGSNFTWLADLRRLGAGEWGLPAHMKFFCTWFLQQKIAAKFTALSRCSR